MEIYLPPKPINLEKKSMTTEILPKSAREGGKFSKSYLEPKSYETKINKKENKYKMLTWTVVIFSIFIVSSLLIILIFFLSKKFFLKSKHKHLNNPIRDQLIHLFSSSSSSSPSPLNKKTNLTPLKSNILNSIIEYPEQIKFKRINEILN